MKHVLIVANGEQPKPPQHWNRIKRANPLICTDGAANWLLEREITPDVIIGDLDSLDESLRDNLDHETIRHVPTQDNTDLEKTLLYALDQGYTAATVLGATGKRDDQTLANLYLLVKYSDKIHIQLLTNYSTIEAVTGEFTTRVEKGQTISLLPVGKVSGVTTKGLKYPLENETLEIGTRGVSNLAADEEITVSVTSGTLLLFRNFD
ncbi:MAG: thiamine diphosphokinase [Candidatus Marinimicrobia bacterium]|nr:thiamine diphosphokinase [Candidatus Neomarinimicrobiota bacterium]MCF7828353.1 thiamine diphosphokinase [Candidatus Neomarinimicrobiota bacterium]MCF7881054.1 thiamine diphosphokinase [Candidatus Neomarinimicrobiota bacterium]